MINQYFTIFACLSYLPIELIPILILDQKYRRLILFHLQLHIPVEVFGYHKQLITSLVDCSKLIQGFIWLKFFLLINQDRFLAHIL